MTTFDIRGRLLDCISEFAHRRPELCWHIEANEAAGEYLLIGEELEANERTLHNAQRGARQSFVPHTFIPGGG